MKLDTFESVFRSSIKDRFRFERPELQTALLITDLPLAETEELAYIARVLLPSAEVAIELLPGPDYQGVPAMLERIEKIRPDLLISYRNIGRAKGLPFTLGSHLDTLTQAVSAPVVVLPPPTRANFAELVQRPERVMVITDHLTGDNRLVSWGAHFCTNEGTLYLAHVEDDATFARYADAIGKLPDIDTDVALERLRAKLLQLPSDYVATIAAELDEQGDHERVEPLVRMGNALTDYKRLIEEQALDLLVMNAKDDRQLAMHGMAYALTVEIRDIPLLLL